MNDSANQAFDPNTMFHQWMRSVTDAWSGVLTPTRTESGPASSPSDSSAGKDAGSSSLDTALRMMKASASMMGDPGSWAGMMTGMHSLPHVFVSMMQPMIENMTTMHRQWLEKIESIGKIPDAFDITHLEKESFNIFNRLYDAEFRKFLNVPQIGPARQYQEKLNHYLDRLTLLQTAVAEFVHQLYVPMESAHLTFQKKLADLAEARQLPEDPRAYYQLWLKTLEGHYMNALRTPEYLGALSKTLAAAADHALARKDLLNDLMRSFSLPAPGDMDSLYKDLYDLKKRLKIVEQHIGDH